MILSILISLLLLSSVVQVEDSTLVQTLDHSVIPSEVEGSQEGGINVSEVIFDHIGDAYEWHITEWKGKPISIPLPVIVHSSTGWHCFSSAKLEHGEEYQGLRIDTESGKIIDTTTGKRPFDISITKNVLSLMFSAALLLIIVLLTAR